MKLHTMFQIVLVILGGALLSIIVWYDFAPSGDLRVHYDLEGYNPSISKIFPEGRATTLEGEHDTRIQTALAEPLYFTVRLPRCMNSAHVRVLYKSENISSLRFGLNTQASVPGGVWQYELRDITQTSVDGPWQVIDETFSLDHAAVQNNAIRFIISAPDVAKGGTLALHKIDVRLNGDPLTIQSALSSLWRRLASAL